MVRKHFKKLVCLALSSIMVIGMSATAFAAETADETEKTVKSGGYTFEITEKTEKDYTVVRTYENIASRARSTTNLGKAKAMLAALGMTEEEINAFPSETLYDIATAKDIVISTSYTRHSEDGNTTVGVPAKTATEAAAVLTEEQEDYFIEKLQAPAVSKAIANESTTPGVFKDSYMKITHTAIHLGGGSYKYTVSSEWLTMPFFRGYDSIGSCAMNGTVTPNTSSGKYWYTTKTINMGNITSTPSGNITITNKSNKVNGNWYGSAGVFNLPNDVSNPNGVSLMHTGLKAYYEYKGNVTFPTLASNFNSTGTYSHATLTVSVSPSVSINTSGTASASIGLKIVGGTDVRNAELEVKYKP